MLPILVQIDKVMPKTLRNLVTQRVACSGFPAYSSQEIKKTYRLIIQEIFKHNLLVWIQEYSIVRSQCALSVLRSMKGNFEEESNSNLLQGMPWNLIDWSYKG